MKRKLIILAFFFLVQQLNAQINIQHLRCEMLVNPLGIDIKEPRLSWQLNSSERNVQQSAYEIIVSSSREKLLKNDGDVWVSGKVNVTQSIHIKYVGKELQSGKEYFCERGYVVVLIFFAQLQIYFEPPFMKGLHSQ